jgi:uncharacterized metal-binding protein YceD (DUF177 family)
MKNTMKVYDIHFSALKLGEHQFTYEFGKEFFTDFGNLTFKDVSLKALILLEKKENALQLQFKLTGQALLNCDITNEPFWHPLKSETTLAVKFGDAFDDTNEEILILPQGEHSLNVAQYLYELAILAKPQKVIHPEVEAGNMGQKELKKLKELSPDNKGRKETEAIDPRWNKLKDLLK